MTKARTVVLNVVAKFDAEEILERDWALPTELTGELAGHVTVAEDGGIVNVWPVTDDIRKLVQPWVDEHIDTLSGAWFVCAWDTAA